MLNDNPEYEFSESQNKHFFRLGRKCQFLAILFVVFAIENLIVTTIRFMRNLEANPLYLILSVIAFISLIATAIWLNQAATRYYLIVSSAGRDLTLLESSNKKLQRAFTGIMLAFSAVCIRHVLVIYAVNVLTAK